MLKTLSAALALSTCLGSAWAKDRIDYRTTTGGPQGGPVVFEGETIDAGAIIDGVLHENTEAGSGDPVISVGRPAVGKRQGFCFLAVPDKTGCAGSGRLVFPEPITDLTFRLLNGSGTLTEAQPGTGEPPVDRVIIRFFNPADDEIAVLRYSSAADPEDPIFESFTGEQLRIRTQLINVKSISFEDQSTDGGFGYGNLRFNFLSDVPGPEQPSPSPDIDPLDFKNFPEGTFNDILTFQGETFGGSVEVGGALLTNLDAGTNSGTIEGGVEIGRGAGGVRNGFCFLGGAGQSGCQADGTIRFPSPITDLRFTIDNQDGAATDGQSGGDQENFDQVTIRLFNSVDDLVEEFVYTSNPMPTNDVDAIVDGRLRVRQTSAFGDITRIEFDDSSQDGGFAFSRFRFSTQN